MSYDGARLTVKLGKANNAGTQAIALGAKGDDAGFIPESTSILWHSKLLDNGKEKVIEFPPPCCPASIPTFAHSPAITQSCAA